MLEPTNANRAARCEVILLQYADDCDTRAGLNDFLADARHFCDLAGCRYSDLDKLAR